MKETTIPSKKFILNYGLILGIISIIYGLILYVTDNVASRNWIFAVISAVILISIIFYGINAYKMANNGFLKLGGALKIGIGIALIGGVISIIWNVILMNVIEPDMMNQIFDIQREEMIKRNHNMSREQIDQSIAMAEKISSPYVMPIFSLIWNLFLGFIISLIGGAIMQKNRDVF
ncbi:DUF4199 domain-containing protein [Aquimarina sp. AU58]|uniref:DUF4199 domain-containing protein n=1 Tax=Aquimarina sp. AU58 TaxID=1874112 RepID=UPI000D6E807A|nr:DUF4199 domain-containing protein [Aquimarina sp. AU58]